MAGSPLREKNGTAAFAIGQVKVGCCAVALPAFVVTVGVGSCFDLERPFVVGTAPSSYSDGRSKNVVDREGTSDSDSAVVPVTAAVDSASVEASVPGFASSETVVVVMGYV